MYYNGQSRRRVCLRTALDVDVENIVQVSASAVFVRAIHLESCHRAVVEGRGDLGGRRGDSMPLTSREPMVFPVAPNFGLAIAYHTSVEVSTVYVLTNFAYP